MTEVEPLSESARLESLRSFRILDTPPEQDFDDLASLAATICQSPIALISLVDEHRQWFKAKIGTDLEGTPRDIAFCAHGIQESDLFVVEDALADPRFKENPLVTGPSGIRFYAGAPLRTPDGHALGMLCVNDRVPRKLREEQLNALRILSRQVVSQLLLRRRENELQRMVDQSRRFEHNLHQRTDLLQLQQVISAAANEARSPREAMDSALQLMCAYAGWPAGHVVSHNGTAGVDAEFSWHVTDPQRCPHLVERVRTGNVPSRTDIAAKVMRDGRAAWVEDLPSAAARDGVVLRQFVEMGFKSAIAFPVWAGNEVAAVLEFFSEVPAALNERLLQVGSYVGTQVGRTIERSRAEHAVNEQKILLEAILRQAADAIIVCDAHGKLMFVNAAARRLALSEPGQSRLTDSEKVWGIALDAEGRRLPVEEWSLSRALRGQSDYARQIRMIRPDESHYDLLMSAAPVLSHDGGILGAVATFTDITSLRRVEESLKESELKYHSLFENSADAVFLLSEVFLDCNEQACRLLGCTREEILGQRPEAFSPPFQPNGSASRDSVIARIRAAMAGTPQHFYWKLSRKDGFTIDTDISLKSVVVDGKPVSLASVRDVTETHRAIEALRHRVEVEKLVASISADFMNLRDGETSAAIERSLARIGEFLKVDRGYVFLFGPRQVSASSTHQWCAPGIEAPRDMFQNVRVTDFPWLYGRLAANQVIPVSHVKDLPPEAMAERAVIEAGGIRSALVVPMFANASLVGMLGLDSVEQEKSWPPADVGMLRMVAEIFANALTRERYARELHETNARLQEALTELQRTQKQVVQQERLRALGQMASGVAHDFNNALAPIMGFSELLLLRPETRANTTKLTHYLEVMNTAAKDAAHIVRRLREFYRSREESETLSPVQLSRLVEEAVSLTQPRWKDQAQASGIQIRVETDLCDTPPISGREADLREVLTNLIFNAVDAMPRGGTLTLRTRADQQHVFLELADTGTGMTEEVRKRCLEAFFTTKGAKGTGLGLAMVHSIVRSHDGSLEIESAPGKGTKFTLRFPVRTETRPEALSAAAPTVGTAALTLLLVDDEPKVREIETEYLKAEGHTVVAADSGLEGIVKFRQGRFDVAILDRAMPGMSGDQVAAAIKKISPQTPVILLTGFGELMNASGDMPPNVDFVLGKPVTLADLSSAVARAAVPRPA